MPSTLFLHIRVHVPAEASALFLSASTASLKHFFARRSVQQALRRSATGSTVSQCHRCRKTAAEPVLTRKNRKAKPNTTRRKSHRLPKRSRRVLFAIMQSKKRQAHPKRIRSQCKQQEQYERTFASSERALIPIQKEEHAHRNRVLSQSYGQEQCETTHAGSEIRPSIPSKWRGLRGLV